MSDKPIINRIEVTEFTVELENMGTDYNGFNIVYSPGEKLRSTRYALTIGTSVGIDGEFVGGAAEGYAQLGVFAHYLLGKNALNRELIYNDVKRALRKNDRLGIGPVDIALWDIAGKYYGAPIYELLGVR